jgi:hypothetical protein
VNGFPPLPLPAGQMIHGDEGDDDRPAFWLGDGRATPGAWAKLLEQHAESGWWPLLLDDLPGGEGRPWETGEVWPGDPAEAAGHDAAELLADWWASHTEPSDDDQLSEEERRAVTAPFGREWPGLAAASGASPESAVAASLEHADALLRQRPSMRLGLVEAASGTDALVVAGWDGPANYAATAEIAAVLRSWQHRFGATVVGVGFADLYVSVAAPPANRAEALAVAAEHFAFCPDNVWQGTAPFTLAAYADRLVGARGWTFWWD